MRQQDRPPTPEQIEIVRWTASLGAVTAEALAQRTDASVASARAKLLAARRRKLLASVRPLSDGPRCSRSPEPVCGPARHAALRCAR